MLQNLAMSVAIGNAAETEIDTITSLWHAGWHDAHAAIVPRALTELRTLDSFRERTKRHLERTRVARQDDRIVAFCMTKDDELYQMYVAPVARGKRVAQLLMQDAEHKLRASGVSRAWLACAIGNERAARFYRKCGWIMARIETENLETAAGAFPLEIWRFEKALSV